MKSKVFYEENRTIVICLTNDDNVVIEIFDHQKTKNILLTFVIMIMILKWY